MSQLKFLHATLNGFTIQQLLSLHCLRKIFSELSAVVVTNNYYSIIFQNSYNVFGIDATIHELFASY